MQKWKMKFGSVLVVLSMMFVMVGVSVIAGNQVAAQEAMKAEIQETFSSQPQEVKDFLKENAVKNFDGSYTLKAGVSIVETDNFERSVLLGVAIFVAGVAVGYIVDGVIIYHTGKSAGEWVAEALEWYNKLKHLDLKKIMCDAVRVLSAENNAGCVIVDKFGTMHCPVR